MRSHPLTRRRVTAGLVAGTLILAACGDGDDDSGNAGAALPAAGAATDTEQADTGQADTVDAAPAPTDSTRIDLVGADVIPAADVDSNPLPSVVVNDLNTGQAVNFRNLVPQEKPILLWMWAPH